MKIAVLLSLVVLATAAPMPESDMDLSEVQSMGPANMQIPKDILESISKFRDYVSKAVEEYNNIVNFAGAMNQDGNSKRQVAAVNPPFLAALTGQPFDIGSLGAGQPDTTGAGPVGAGQPGISGFGSLGVGQFGTALALNNAYRKAFTGI